MIDLVHVRQDFGNIMPLVDVNAHINKGDVIAIIGPSGCGKSTLLRNITMLTPPTSGQIILEGEEITAPGYDVSKLGRKMGMVFQHFNLFEHWTAVENIMNPQMTLLGCTKQEAYDCAMELLEKVGLSSKALWYPDELSGGQKQRVAIARTLAMKPEIIAFDEPTSALDPANVGEVEQVIRALAQRGITMLIVTHEMRFAREISNRVFYIDEGMVYEEGTPEQIFEHPQRDKTRRFVRQFKSVEIDITPREFDFPALVSKIDDYCAHYRLPYQTARRLQAVVEELCVSMLIPRMPQEFRMNIALEYQVSTGEAHVVVCYDGPAFDPRTAGDEISQSILQAQLQSMDYAFLGEQGEQGEQGADGEQGVGSARSAESVKSAEDAGSAGSVGDAESVGSAGEPQVFTNRIDAVLK